MKKIVYILGGLILLVLVVALGAIAYLQVGFPKVSPAKDITVEATADRLVRGEYLVRHVSLCLDCHSAKNPDYFSSPIIAGTEGKGGELFPGIPGKLYNPNITPAALNDWSDGEIVRAITSGVDKDNRPLAPMMPFIEYRYLAEEDIYSIVAYLRSMPAIENEVPESSIDFPFNLIFRTVPTDPDPQPLPDPSDTLATGKYLTRIAGCMFCHTPAHQGTPIEGKELSGGYEFTDPNTGTLRSTNLTPDMETGIGGWSKEVFINRFKAFADSTNGNIPVSNVGFQTVMPWTLLGGMTEGDLGAIYTYLQSLGPIRNKVEKFTPAQL